jgi:hypothetical protein
MEVSYGHGAASQALYAASCGARLQVCAVRLACERSWCVQRGVHSRLHATATQPMDTSKPSQVPAHKTRRKNMPKKKPKSTQKSERRRGGRPRNGPHNCDKKHTKGSYARCKIMLQDGTRCPERARKGPPMAKGGTRPPSVHCCCSCAAADIWCAG